MKDMKSKSAEDKCIISLEKDLKNKQNKNMNEIHFSLCIDVLMYPQGVVVPTALQRCVLHRLHRFHPGISRMNALIMSYVLKLTTNRNFENLATSELER